VLLLRIGSWYLPTSRGLLRGVLVTTFTLLLLSLALAELVCLVWLRVIIFGTVIIFSFL
jgi:hypothetical protein